MVITIAAQKGGVGKTTTAISLASYFARNGKKTLLIDIDGQGNSSQVLLPDFDSLPENETVAAILLKEATFKVHKTNVSNLYIIPSNVRLSEAEQILGRLPAKERRLKLQLDKIKNQYDVIFIDCPPNVNDLPYNSLVSSDYVIIPIQADVYNLRGLLLMFEKIEEVQSLFNPSLKIIGLLPTIYDQTTNISKEVYNGLVKQFKPFSEGGLVFSTKIPRNNDLREAAKKNMDIYEYKPYAPSALAYEKFIKTELIPYLLEQENGK